MKRLSCCVCGEVAPARRQWWNRDQGFGLCGACAVQLQRRPDYDADEFRECYGDEGVHWFALKPAPAPEVKP
jgi:hypothetical protein